MQYLRLPENVKIVNINVINKVNKQTRKQRYDNKNDRFKTKNALFARRPSIGLIGNLSSCNAQFCCGVMKQVMQLVLLIRYGHQRGTAYQLFVLK